MGLTIGLGIIALIGIAGAIWANHLLKIPDKYHQPRFIGVFTV
ncbi:Uncharacterised protein [Rodentibacter pneumotropicus]|uniref:Uncharacterized protein n=1 Tax=Rodentibacter pneumotropicus TaxID=758 RepID=A0A3S4TXU5_9PAST|nr:Uncharacterised protein [Rodentibacter pneumotropicus]